MTDTINKKLLLGLACLVVVVNVWVLTVVWLNRADPTGNIVLSERELDVPYYYDDENSGISLGIKYRFLSHDGNDSGFYSASNPEWLDTAKMISLGFTEAELYPLQANSNMVKEVFVVLQLDGDAYRESLRRARREHEQQLLKKVEDRSSNVEFLKNKSQREEKVNSRLFVIDAETDLEALQVRYKNSYNVMYTKAIISTLSWYSNIKSEKSAGRIDSLSVSGLYVPYPLNEKIKSLELRDYDDFQPSRFEVKLKIGAHLTPWVSDIKLSGS